MRKEIAEVIFEQLQAECIECRLRDNYSGRGMYGSETRAISGDFGNGDVAEAIASAFVLGYMDEFPFTPKDLNYTTDNMGLGIVIY